MVEVKDNALIPLDAMQRVNQALDFCRSVQVVEIKTADQAGHANELFKQLSLHTKVLEDLRKEVKEPYLRKGKQIDDWFKDPQNAIASLKGKLDLAIRQFKAKLEDERRRKQAELDRQAAEDRRRKEEAAEKERQKAEAYRQQGRDDLAQKAEARAEQKQVAAETVIAAEAQVYTPDLSGTTVRANWKMQINDPEQFVKWAAQQEKYHLLMPNQTTCNAYAKSMKQDIAMPGARIINDEKLSGTGR